MTPIWATVALSLGAAAITALAGFGTIWWQQERLARGAADDQKSTAYLTLVAHSLGFIIRAQTLKAFSEQQSSVADRVEIEMRSQMPGRLETNLRTRPPLDLLGLHDWLAASFDPVNAAWATVKVFGSPDVIASADALVISCSACLETATQVGAARRSATRQFFGAKWTPEQEALFEISIQDVKAARDSFVEIANREFATKHRQRRRRR